MKTCIIASGGGQFIVVFKDGGCGRANGLVCDMDGSKRSNSRVGVNIMDSLRRAMLPAWAIPHEQREEAEQAPVIAPEPLLVICAWCGRVMQQGTGVPSHGICDECERTST